MDPERELMAQMGFANFGGAQNKRRKFNPRVDAVLSSPSGTVYQNQTHPPQVKDAYRAVEESTGPGSGVNASTLKKPRLNQALSSNGNGSLPHRIEVHNLDEDDGPLYTEDSPPPSPKPSAPKEVSQPAVQERATPAVDLNDQSNAKFPPGQGPAPLNNSSGDTGRAEPELEQYRWGVRNKDGDMVYFQPSFIEDPWLDLRRQKGVD
ncbi:MAG: hypothetical protein M1814_004997 [Vezdaea aestivalis]|nr:MAG: hypothetical protein M1814_004997 [Vezdaea aestivalis]